MKPVCFPGDSLQRLRDERDFETRYRYRRETIYATAERWDVERWEVRKPESCASVWDAIAHTAGQAANLLARAELMRQIAAFVKRQGWRK